MDGMKRLDFSLPRFQRMSWVSAQLRLEWAAVLDALPVMIQEVFASPEVVQLVPLQARNIDAADVYQYKLDLRKKGIWAEHIEEYDPVLKFLFGLIPAPGKVAVVFGKKEIVTAFLHHPGSIHAHYDIPLRFWKQYAQSGLIDTAWAYLQHHEPLHGIVSLDASMLNPLWQVLGIRALPYNTYLQDDEALQLAHEIRAHAETLLPENLLSAWHELLSWPAEWSALHGIAEIKTPLFKLMYNTDATAAKHVLRLQSGTYPVNGPDGLLFPYRQPRKKQFSGSMKFNRGIEHFESLHNNTNQ